MYKQVYSFVCAIILVAMFFALETSVASAGNSTEFSNLFRHSSQFNEFDACDTPSLHDDAYGSLKKTERPFPLLAEFTHQLAKSQTQGVIGVYACRILALQVSQQPLDNPVFVSSDLGVATQFRLAANYGTIGLLAHNDRSGMQFFNLHLGNQIAVVYGDGTVRRYVVSSIRHFQTLKPEDPYSNFNDLDTGESNLSSTFVFQQIFSAGDQVVFQTCIDANGNPSWGRLFVIAKPLP